MPMGRMIKAENCVVRSRLCVRIECWHLIYAASLENLTTVDEVLHLFSDVLSCEVPQLLRSLPRMPTLINVDLFMEDADLEDKGYVSLQMVMEGMFILLSFDSSIWDMS